MTEPRESLPPRTPGMSSFRRLGAKLIKGLFGKTEPPQLPPAEKLPAAVEIVVPEPPINPLTTLPQESDSSLESLIPDYKLPTHLNLEDFAPMSERGFRSINDAVSYRLLTASKNLGISLTIPKEDYFDTNCPTILGIRSEFDVNGVRESISIIQREMGYKIGDSRLTEAIMREFQNGNIHTDDVLSYFQEVQMQSISFHKNQLKNLAEIKAADLIGENLDGLAYCSGTIKAFYELRKRISDGDVKTKNEVEQALNTATQDKFGRIK